MNFINKKYVQISNRVNPEYEQALGLPCDLYFPIFNTYKEDTKYRDMKVFAPHQSASYNNEPDKTDVMYYIPYLIKKESMNSSEEEFDSFYTEGEAAIRPFIETTKKKELPIQTKVVVKQGRSIMKFFVDKKLVVTGADGFMVLRMYLSPLAKDNDNGEDDALDQEEFVNPLQMEIPDDDDF